MANGILSQLPSLTSVVDAQETLSSKYASLMATLPSDTDSLITPLTAGLTSLEEAIPADPATLITPLKTVFEDIAEQLPSEELSAIQDFGTQLTKVLDILKPLQELLGSDDGLRDLRDLVMEQVGDPSELINSLISEFNAFVPTESLEVLQTFVTTLQTFESNLPTNPTEVAQFLAQSFLGVPLNLLAEPLAVVNGFGTQIDSLLEEANLESFNTDLQITIADLNELANQLQTLDLADTDAYSTVLARLTTAQTQLAGLHTHLDGLAGEFEAGLSNLNPEALSTTLQQALETVPEIKVAQVEDFLQLVLEPIQTLNDRLDSLTPEDLAQRLREANTFLDTVIAEQGFDDARAGMLKPFTAIGDAISSLDLAQVRTAISEVFDSLGEGITSITSQTDGVKEAMQAAFDRIDPVLATLAQGGEQVETAIAEVGSAIETAVAEIPFQALQEKIESLLERVNSLIAEFGPILDDALSRVANTIGQLEEVDFGVVAEPILEAIRSLKSTLESINENQLSEAELSAFRVGASVLSTIDISPVNQFILEKFDGLHPSDLVNVLMDQYRTLTDKLADYNPAHLLAPLEEPFEQVFGSLSQFDPGKLLDRVLEPIERLTQLLGNLEGLLSQAIAPLVGFFDSLKQALDDLAPSKLLAPLAELFGRIMELFEKLDIAPFLNELEGLYGQWMQQALEELQQVGNVFTDAGNIKSYLDPETPDPDGDSLGFMPGDILRPVEDVYNKILAALERIPEATLVNAFEQLKGKFVQALAAISPLNLSAQISLSLQEQLARFDFTQQFDRIAGLYSAYSNLALAFDGIDPVQVPVPLQESYRQMAEIVPSLNPELTLAPLRSAFQTLNRATLAIAAGLDVSQLASAFVPVSEKLEALVPAFLKEELDLTHIQTALQALNPGRLADEVNGVYEQFALKTARFGDVFVAELPPIIERLSASTTGFLPTVFEQAFNEIYTPLKTQLAALNPADIVADLEEATYTPLLAALDSIHPNLLLANLNLDSKVQASIDTIDGITTSLKQLQATVSQQWTEILANIDQLNPIRLLEDTLNAAFEEIQLATTLDPQDIIDRLDRLMAIIREDLERALNDIDTALAEMLAAVPS